MAGRAHFELFRRGDDFRWRLRATNGETLATSEAYTRKADAERGIKDVHRALIDPVPIEDLTEE